MRAVMLFIAMPIALELLGARYFELSECMYICIPTLAFLEFPSF